MPRALVLGGYGLIGSACMRALAAAGFEVTGVGRSLRAAQACDRGANWLIRDIPGIEVAEWRSLLAGVDVVVNASGALQDGALDDLRAIHETTLSRLTEAQMPARVVQISAAGVSETASTDFFRTKARGDAILAARGRDWVILRPVLVLSHEAWGGTALLRAAASLPLVLPRVLPGAPVQTVHVGDVAAAVVAAARGELPSGTIADLTEPDATAFPDLLTEIRRWLGWPEPRFRPEVPARLLTATGRIADLLGHLGWRAPLRTTALRALADGVRGDPGPREQAGGRPCRSLAETLAQLPATRQERLYARAFLALPLAIATLALFWTLSGLIALADPQRAIALLIQRGLPETLASPIVLGGALADLALGLALLWRPWTRSAALGMAGLSALYLAGSLAVAPDLWADPLGPMLKVLPGMALALLVWLLTEVAMTHDLLLFLHVTGATVLLGTGAGIAFFMVMSHQSGDPRLIAHVAGIVVLADTLFTATAAVLQPVTGVLLARQAGWPILEGWVAWSLALYLIVGAFWLPVVGMQIVMRNLARTARDSSTPLPPLYHRLYRLWFACGVPAFASVLAILWLMLTKPAL